MSDTAIVVLCAVGGRDEASGIAHALIEQRLAACVQMTPVESWYRWDGAVQHETEAMLHIKTMRSRFAQLCETTESLHSYDVPEIVALPITDASPRYLEWVLQSVC